MFVCVVLEESRRVHQFPLELLLHAALPNLDSVNWTHVFCKSNACLNHWAMPSAPFIFKKQNLSFYVSLFVCLCVHICIYVSMNLPLCGRNQFSLPTVWVPGRELRWSGLAASTFIHWAMAMTQFPSVYWPKTFGVLSTWQKLELSGKKDPQLRKCLHHIEVCGVFLDWCGRV